MKRVLFVLLSLFLFNSLFAQQFHSLDGIEDTQGNSILLYRFGENYFPFNPVYKFNANTLEETLLIQAFYSSYPSGALAKAVNDFEFFPSDEINFMNVGYEINPDNHSYIARNDSIVFGGFSSFERVDISRQNPLKVFVFGSDMLVRSWDGGYTFPADSIQTTNDFIQMWISDFDDQLYFGFNAQHQFAKNSVVVDTSRIFIDEYTKLLFDVNQFHIYRVNKTYGGIFS